VSVIRAGADGRLRYYSGKKGRWGEGSCRNHSPYLFVPRPGAAGKCLSEYTLVLFLRRPNLDVPSSSNCASVESKFWKESKRSLEASVWREPDGLNPSLTRSQETVRVPGQCGANLDDAFQMVCLLALGLGPVGAPGRSPKVAPQRAQGSCPDGRNQA
jgi:hypothetical protein